MKNRIAQIFFIFVTILGLIFIVFFRINNHSKTTLTSRLEIAKKIVEKNNKIAIKDSVFKVGWGKANITPHTISRIVGYGWRNEFEGIHDSLYVRSLVLENGNQKVAIISYDLLLLTPNIKRETVKALSELGIKNIYFSATHTHNSFGGYGEGLIGEVLLSGNNIKTAENIVNKTFSAVKQSLLMLDTLKRLTYFKQNANQSLNRITHERNVLDVLRTLRFYTSTKTGNIISSNSHPTILRISNSLLSNDYPGELINSDTTDFAMFVSGTMGSLAAITPQEMEGYEKIKFFKNELIKNKPSSALNINLDRFKFSSFNFGKVEKTFLINEFIEIRPWVFSLLIGKSSNEIQTVRIGQLLMIALPCELSYEYYPALENYANENGLSLMITSFNGSYLGYCTPEEHHAINHMETREMNWMGEYGGEYFKEVIKMIIKNQ